jgi:hypothetical protein
MTLSFLSNPAPDYTELSLASADRVVPFEHWAAEAPARLRAGVDLALRLEAAGSAVPIDDTLFVDHSAVAGLTAHEATLLALPPATDAVADITSKGVVTQPDYEVTLRWQRSTGQSIADATRVGPWLRIGDKWHRLPEPLYGISEAVDAVQKAGGDAGSRLTALAALAELLPGAQRDGAALPTGMLGQIKIHVADAFSLDLEGEGENTRLIPVLHRAGGDPHARLLPEPLQDAFAQRQFYGFVDARGVYALGNGHMLALNPPLRRALSVVRRVQSASPATRRALFANPRLFLRDALDDDSETLIENVFRETPAYSERVIGLGLWQKRVIPWVEVSATDWFHGAPPGRPYLPSDRGGILIDGRRLDLTGEEAEDLRGRVETAIGLGEPSVEMPGPDGPIRIPATYETLTAVAKLGAARAQTSSAGARPPAEVLLIHPNEDTLGLEALVGRRPTPAQDDLNGFGTPPKQHQSEGVAWLQKAWAEGLPGVLLADDMGLGKTLQGLGFLAWLRRGMAEGTVPREPVIVVALTGLLATWQKEHAEHVTAPGLGECVSAFATGLRSLRREDLTGRPTIDVEAVRNADWVLTTYETLRDYDRDFGQVRFAAAIFDEAQKIKTPGIRLTDAAKGMNIGFRIALTGTPIENRLADLWCIVDGVHPGCLGDLKTFSRQFEQEQNPEQLSRLRATLDHPVGGRPPIMLRRLRRDRLPDLPPLEQEEHPRAMPPIQAAAYESTIMEARAGSRGDVLGALQRLRSVSLHPCRDDDLDDDAFIAASARFLATFAALDRIAEEHRRALIFVDDLDIQARLAGIIQRRFRLSAAPMMINGTVSGAHRQARVDRFQSAPDGFAAIILSPRAAGVGLTLTRANHVIHLSRWWNPAVEDQCNGRALRIGQTRPVTVHIPLAVLPRAAAIGGRSFDENLHALLERKRRLMHEALIAPEASDSEKEQLLRETLGA